MWISGRRAFRPDSGYYRAVRKRPGRAGRQRRGAGMLAIAAVFVLLLFVGIWWMLKH